MDCVCDNELPVAYQACQALRFLCATSSKTRHLIVPALPHMVDSIMHVMEQVGNGDTFAALEELVTRFPEEVAPHGAKIGGALCTKVTDLIAQAAAGGGDAGGTALALSAAFPALIEILQALRDSPKAFEPLEGPLVNLVQTVIAGLPGGGTSDWLNDTLEVFPPPLPYKVDTSRPSLRTNWTRLDPFQVFNFLTYCAPALTAAMWALFRPLCEAWDRHNPVEIVRPPPLPPVQSGHVSSIPPY